MSIAGKFITYSSNKVREAKGDATWLVISA